MGHEILYCQACMLTGYPLLIFLRLRLRSHFTVVPIRGCDERSRKTVGENLIRGVTGVTSAYTLKRIGPSPP